MQQKTYTIAELNGLLVEYIQGLQNKGGEQAGIVILDISPFLEFIEKKEK